MELFSNVVMCMSYLYSKLPEAGVPHHIGTGGRERDTKLAVLRLYRSQWRIMEPFLASFVRQNELFTLRSYPPETAPPHFEADSSTAAAGAKPGT